MGDRESFVIARGTEPSPCFPSPLLFTILFPTLLLAEGQLTPTSQGCCGGSH